MTDEEKFRALLAEWGVTPADPETWGISPHSVMLVAGEGNVGGYMGFEVTFGFNDDGSFDDVGVWE